MLVVAIPLMIIIMMEPLSLLLGRASNGHRLCEILECSSACRRHLYVDDHFVTTIGEPCKIIVVVFVVRCTAIYANYDDYSVIEIVCLYT